MSRIYLIFERPIQEIEKKFKFANDIRDIQFASDMHVREFVALLRGV